jgi:MarR family transcriptional regulator, lower aerobic nicotinate degradation pathway regulator
VLGHRAKLDGSDVVAALDELEARGLVKRRADPSNRRSNIVTLTSAGRFELRRLDKTLAHVQAELLAPLSDSQQSRLVRALATLLEHHSAREPDGDEPA